MSKHKNQKGKLDVAAFESVTPRMSKPKEDVGKRVLALLRKIKKEEDMASQGSGSAGPAGHRAGRREEME